MLHQSSAIGRVAGSLHPAVLLRLFLFTLLAPLLLFAYLGSFSRLMSDDYCAIAVGQELGAWEGMAYWYNSWAGSYANFYFKSAIAGLDTVAPALTPLLIVSLLWLAATFVIAQILRHLKIAAARLMPAILLASASVVAGVNALYSPQSFYWFAASTHYTLPLALLVCFCGLPLWIGLADTRGRDLSGNCCAGRSDLLCQRRRVRDLRRLPAQLLVALRHADASVLAKPQSATLCQR